MTQQEIQERNNQIALMLNDKYEHSYHLDWNWLMEAVEFIRLKNWSYDMYCPSSIMDIDGLFECNFWDKINPEIEGRSKNSLKEAVFLSVSDFANLYNEKKI